MTFEKPPTEELSPNPVAVEEDPLAAKREAVEKSQESVLDAVVAEMSEYGLKDQEILELKERAREALQGSAEESEFTYRLAHNMKWSSDDLKIYVERKFDVSRNANLRAAGGVKEKAQSF
jgi:hypothetical protein